MRPLLSQDGKEDKHLYAPWYCVISSAWKAKPAALSFSPHITWSEVHLLQENRTWIIWQKDNGPCSLHVKHCMNNIKITLLWALHVTRHYYTESSPNSLSSFWSTHPRNCNKAPAKKPTHFYFNITTEIRISFMTKCHREVFQCRFEQATWKCYVKQGLLKTFTRHWPDDQYQSL